MALRTLAGDRVTMALVSPDPVFCYRPAATAEVFAEGPSELYDLRSITSDFGATHHRARLESVGPTAKYVRLSSGVRLEYDMLVLAVGARGRSSISGALTFRDQRDGPLFRRLLADVRQGNVTRLVFALPAGFSWPVPLLELALLSRTYAAEHGRALRITVVSPESRPLAAFGSEASCLVEELLETRQVHFVGGATAEAVRRGGSLELNSGERIEADRVVATPQLRGQWITGIPASWWGFVPTDVAGAVDGVPDVYAAGDMTTFPIKQAGLATQQSDRIAHAIAERIGVAVPSDAEGYVLQARLLGGERPLVLRAQLDNDGEPVTAELASNGGDRWAMGHSKVFARHLTPYLESQQPFARGPLIPA